MCNELIEKLKWAQTEKLNILSGFDGFVDEIIHVVDKRIDKDNYIRVKTIEDYGHKILNAAGVSSNIENVVVQRKMGGNGPILPMDSIVWALMSPTWEQLVLILLKMCFRTSLKSKTHRDCRTCSYGCNRI